MSSQNEESDFKITDRRKFTEDGKVRPEAAATAAATPKATPGPEPRGRQAARPEKERHAPPSLDFGSFLVSLGTSGLLQLGEIPDPETRKPAEDLEGARQTIEVLGLLKEKTKGNLTPDENRLLDTMLYELRMKFLAKSKVIRI
jgi:hypothetical protein